MVIGEENRFRTGNKVKLNIGGPEMSVESCEAKVYVCRWFVNGVAKTGTFTEDCLESSMSSRRPIIHGSRNHSQSNSVQRSKYEHYTDAVRVAIEAFKDAPPPPPDGWIRTVRKALRLSGRQLAARLGVTMGRIYKIEQDETAGSVTLKTMKATADAMDCHFVYAVIPNRDIELLTTEIRKD